MARGPSTSASANNPSHTVGTTSGRSWWRNRPISMTHTAAWATSTRPSSSASRSWAWRSSRLTRVTSTRRPAPPLATTEPAPAPTPRGGRATPEVVSPHHRLFEHRHPRRLHPAAQVVDPPQERPEVGSLRLPQARLESRQRLDGGVDGHPPVVEPELLRMTNLPATTDLITAAPTRVLLSRNGVRERHHDQTLNRDESGMPLRRPDNPGTDRSADPVSRLRRRPTRRPREPPASRAPAPGSCARARPGRASRRHRARPAGPSGA